MLLSVRPASSRPPAQLHAAARFVHRVRKPREDDIDEQVRRELDRMNRLTDREAVLEQESARGQF